MDWKFELTYNDATIEAEEPVGWDAVSFSLKRTQFEHGLVFEYTDELQFYDEAREFIQQAWDAGNIDAQIVIVISVRKSRIDNFEFFYEGILLLNQIRIDRLFAYVKIEPSRFLRDFKARKDLDVELIPNKEVLLHSKIIKQEAEFAQDPDFFEYTRTNFYVNTETTDDSYLPLLFLIGNNELDMANNPVVPYWQDAILSGGVPPTWVDFDFDGETTIDYRLKGQFRDVHEEKVNVRLIIYRLVGDTYTLAPPSVVVFNSGIVLSNKNEILIINFDVDEQLIIDVEKGQRFWLYFRLTYDVVTGGQTSESTHQFISDPESFISVSQLAKTEPSEAKGLSLKDVFAQTVENYTGSPNALTSDFLNFGCGKNILVTNGFQIRKIDNPIFANFADTFKVIQKAFNAGLKVSQNEIRIEPASFFYNKTSKLLTCAFPKDLEREVANDWYFNKINVGWKTWRDDAVGQVNGLDEFNSTRQYDTKLGSLLTRDEDRNRKLLNIEEDKFVVSGYLIEYTRRQIDKDTTDFKFDDSLFLISLNRSEVTSDKYTVPPVSTTYAPGEVSERNEAFALVEDVISPDTVYNLIFSPLRMLRRWGSFLLACLYKNNDFFKDSRFRSGTGNYLMRSMGADACTLTADITENQDLEITAQNFEPVFDGEYLSFSYPLSFTQFEVLRTQEGYIEVISEKGTENGFLVNLEYLPNKGEGQFKLIKAII